MKEEIIKVLGKNHLTPIQFNKEINGIYGLYTYKGDVYVFKDGQDIDYESINNSDMKSVANSVINKNWKLNKSLQ